MKMRLLLALVATVTLLAGSVGRAMADIDCPALYCFFTYIQLPNGDLLPSYICIPNPGFCFDDGGLATLTLPPEAAALRLA